MVSAATNVFHVGVPQPAAKTFAAFSSVLILLLWDEVSKLRVSCHWVVLVALSLVEDERSGTLVGVGEPVHTVVVPVHNVT